MNDKDTLFTKKFFVSEKQKFITFGMLLLVALLFILGLFEIHAVSIRKFNESERVSYVKSEEEQDVSFEIVPRSNETWDKNFNGFNKIYITHAVIFDATVNNNSGYEVTDWKLRVNIPKDVFLNNGWCGTFEIHQFIDGTENVQTLDLRNVSEKDITLDYFKIDQDLMIPLKEGDYFFYNPSTEVQETPIAITGNNPDAKGPTIGFVLYFKELRPYFKDATVLYHFKKNLFDGNDSVMYVGLLLAWLFALVIYITILIYRDILNRRMKQNTLLINSAMSVFTGFFEAKDSYTRGHSKRVAEYSKRIAIECGLNERDVDSVYHIAFMHDCGKCYIPDGILKKEGKLTDEEFEIIKSHTVKGAEMVQDFTAVKGLQDGVRHHHERYDGKGYPDGLKGEEIPWIARVLCIADSYDAMSSDRCYRKKLDRHIIREEFVKCSGKQFDPQLTIVFLKLFDKGRL